MTMITPSYLGETIEYSSLHACRSTLEDPTSLPVSPQPVVTGLPRNVIHLAQLGHRVQIPFLLQYKPHSFVHDTTRFPGHALFLHAPSTRSIRYVPGSFCQTCPRPNRRREQILRRREEQKRQTLYERFQYNLGRKPNRTTGEPETRNHSLSEGFSHSL